MGTPETEPKRRSGPCGCRVIGDPLLGESRGGLGWEKRAVSFEVQLRHTDDAPKTVSLSRK